MSGPEQELIHGPDGAVAKRTAEGWLISLERCLGGILAPADAPRDTVLIALQAFMLGRQVARREAVAAALQRVHNIS